MRPEGSSRIDAQGPRPAAAGPTSAPHGGFVRRTLGRIGFKPEVDFTLAGIFRLRRTPHAQKASAPVLQPRDGPRFRPTPTVPADAPATVELRQTDTLVREGCSTALSELLAAVEDRLRRQPHLEALDAPSLMLASVALVRATGVADASDPQACARAVAATKALSAGHIDPEGLPEADHDAALCAAAALRTLFAAGGSGPRTAAAIVANWGGPTGSDGIVDLRGAGPERSAHRRDATYLAAYCAAADALDPDRRLSFTQIAQKAAATVEHVTDGKHFRTDDSGFPQIKSNHILKDWKSSAQLQKWNVSPSSIRDRIPSIALLALARPPELRSEVERAAISAVRNGLTHDLDGSDLSFANHRTGKLATYARRVTDGLLSRIRHKNPLRSAVELGETQRPLNAIASMRATMRSARTMAGLFDGLHRLGAARAGAAASGSTSATPTAAPQSPVERDALYHAVMFKHWGDRFITTQQFDTKLEDAEKHALVRELENTLGTEGPEIARFRQAVWDQALDPVHLETTGWNLVGYLRSAIDAVAAEQVPAALLRGSVSSAASGSSHAASPRDAPSEPAPIVAQRSEEDIEKAGFVVSMLAETGPTPTADADAPPSPVERLARARAALAELESMLLPLRSGSADAPIHSERARALAERSPDLTRFDTTQARREHPIGFLAQAVRDFELGSSLTLTNGRLHGVGLPFGAATAWIKASPVHALGGVGVRHRTDAVVSASLSSTGGEIFLGTVCGWSGDVGIGAAAGIGGTHVLGAGGGVELAAETTRTQGVYLRIPRNGEADGGTATPTPIGLNGDHVVARRMSDVLEAVHELSRSAQGDHLLLALMARFPELSVSVVRGRDAQTERRPFMFRARIGAGVFAPVVPSVQAVGPGLEGGLERKTRTGRSEAGGRSNVSVRGAHTADRLGGSVSIGGLVSGSNAALLAARTPIAQRGVMNTSILLRQDGAHSPFSFRLASTPNLAQFKRMAARTLPELVAFAQTSDQRRAALVRERVAARPPETTPEAARQAQRDQQAAAILNGIEHLEHDKRGNYAVFSLLRPDAVTALDELHAMANVSRDDPALAGAFASLDREYERLANDPASFQAAYAFQSAEHLEENATGWRVLLNAVKRSTIKWTGVSNMA